MKDRIVGLAYKPLNSSSVILIQFTHNMILKWQLIFIQDIMQILKTPNLMDNVPWLWQEICVWFLRQKSLRAVWQFTGIKREDCKMYFWNWALSAHPGIQARLKPNMSSTQENNYKKCHLQVFFVNNKDHLFLCASKALQTVHISNSVNLRIIQKSKAYSAIKIYHID